MKALRLAALVVSAIVGLTVIAAPMAWLSGGENAAAECLALLPALRHCPKEMPSVAVGECVKAHRIARSIGKLETYEGEAIGDAGSPGQSYRLLRRILKLGPDATPLLVEMSGSRSWVARMAAAVGLGKVPSADGRRALDKLLDDRERRHAHFYGCTPRPLAIASVAAESLAELGQRLSAIEGELRPLGHGRVVEGRSWRSDRVSVVEFAFVGDSFGVIGAAVFDRFEPRIYIDHVTLRGQVDPSRIPKNLTVRAPVQAPLEGREVVAARGTPTEARNLDIANQIWAALDKHDAAQVMAPAADDYRYDDYSAPQALDRAGTQKLVADFVAAIPDFVIAVKPVQFAAGEDVITEMIERGTFRGRHVLLHGLDVKRFRDGRVVKEWQYANYAEVLQQLFGTSVE